MRLPDVVSLIKERGKFQTLSIPRLYFTDSSPAAVQLHISNDSSEKSIANVACFHIINKDQLKLTFRDTQTFGALVSDPSVEATTYALEIPEYPSKIASRALLSSFVLTPLSTNY